MKSVGVRAEYMPATAARVGTAESGGAFATQADREVETQLRKALRELRRGDPQHPSQDLDKHGERD